MVIKRSQDSSNDARKQVVEESDSRDVVHHGRKSRQNGERRDVGGHNRQRRRNGRQGRHGGCHNSRRNRSVARQQLAHNGRQSQGHQSGERHGLRRRERKRRQGHGQKTSENGERKIGTKVFPVRRNLWQPGWNGTINSWIDRRRRRIYGTSVVTHQIGERSNERRVETSEFVRRIDRLSRSSRAT